VTEEIVKSGGGSSGDSDIMVGGGGCRGVGSSSLWFNEVKKKVTSLTE
jgi:hypothetical protein